VNGAWTRSPGVAAAATAAAACPSVSKARAATPRTVRAVVRNASSPREISLAATPGPPTTVVPPNRISRRSPATAAATWNAENPIDTVR
jgi:hypothetical protein